METVDVSKINFVPCVKWLKKGVAKANPDKIQLNRKELVHILNKTRANIIRISDQQQQESQVNNSNADDEFDLEHYDDDRNGEAENPLGLNSLAEIPEADDNFSESDESEKEDNIIKPNDNLVLVGHVEGDASVLEVYVYNEEEESLYVHHDFLLPSLPLCIEWLDKEAGHPSGNYCAIGTMEPIIKVWDLDIVNCLEPAYKLGKKSNRRTGTRAIGHKDAVLDLSWNKNFDHILASGSVDKQIILWDLDNCEPATTLSAFTDKVQCLEWHHLEAQTLLAGSSDQTVKVFDCRSPDTHQSWQIDGEVERVRWHPLQPFSFIASTNTGKIQYFDCRKGSVWAVKAHEKEVTGLAISHQCPGLLVTSSADGTVKVWDINNESEPELVFDKDFNLGFAHCVELCPDMPFVIAAGGDKKSNNFVVYDLRNFDTVKQRFEQRNLIQLVPDEENTMDVTTEVNVKNE